MKSNLEWKILFDSEEFQKEYEFEDGVLGSVYHKDKTNFLIWAPTAESVTLNLYSTGSDEEEGACLLESLPMAKTDRGVFEAEKQGDCHGIYYTYQVSVDGNSFETGDIYAKACGVNGKRSMVVDLERTNPDGWEQDTHVTYPLEDTWIWEVHIGDFSNDPNCGVRPEFQGKYLAFTEEHTHVSNHQEFPTCVAYLKQLGITHVHLLPCFDFGSADESSLNPGFNWGYDPMNYNIPEGSYATDARDGSVRIREFKQMVMALHKAGISVIMDVVYNHTFSLDSNFNRSVPCYYYRQWEDGEFSDGSACGNDTASDRAMFARFMAESVCYWVKEYHIDGFRFDLMGLHDTDTMNRIRTSLDQCCAEGKYLLLYGEPWSAGSSPLRKGKMPANKNAVGELNPRILMFNDDVRDWIKGSYKVLDEPGFINGAKGLERDIIRGIKGWFDKEWDTQPSEPGKIIRYVSAHDNSTLWDKLIDTVKKNHDYQTEYEDVIQLNKLAAAMVMLGKGVLFMQAGEEAGRSKLGEDNSFNLPKELNWLDWRRMYRFQKLTSYYKGLMQVRKILPSLKELTADSIKQMEFMDDLPEQATGYYLDNKQAAVVFNASADSISLNLDGKWRVLVNEDIADANGIAMISGQWQTAPYSASVVIKHEKNI